VTDFLRIKLLSAIFNSVPNFEEMKPFPMEGMKKKMLGDRASVDLTLIHLATILLPIRFGAIIKAKKMTKSAHKLSEVPAIENPSALSTLMEA
jgi:hypothetical protein